MKNLKCRSFLIKNVSFSTLSRVLIKNTTKSKLLCSVIKISSHHKENFSLSLSLASYAQKKTKSAQSAYSESRKIPFMTFSLARSTQDLVIMQQKGWFQGFNKTKTFALSRNSLLRLFVAAPEIEVQSVEEVEFVLFFRGNRRDEIFLLTWFRSLNAIEIIEMLLFDV